jgi:wyosine [tRNA(Phe)-imidazoG37] synthetase (radical SAM superfamily)
LGRSLGINNIPAKSCTYSCRYCQVGRTPRTVIEPRAFYPPEQIVEEVAARLARLAGRREEVHVLTIVPDGEPTLDVRLGETIRALRRFGLPIAVITNGSLLSRPEVRARLRLADWVSVKVDAATTAVWRRINRPHAALRLRAIQEGQRIFAETFEGELVTETMLVDGVNDDESEVDRTARRVAQLAPRRAFLAVPTRPGAEASARAPGQERVTRARALFARHVREVELLTGYEGDDFGATGDPEADLLAATAVHPMRAAQVEALLGRSGAGASVVERLLAAGRLKKVTHGGEIFYVRADQGA